MLEENVANIGSGDAFILLNSRFILAQGGSSHKTQDIGFVGFRFDGAHEPSYPISIVFRDLVLAHKWLTEYNCNMFRFQTSDRREFI